MALRPHFLKSKSNEQHLKPTIWPVLPQIKDNCHNLPEFKYDSCVAGYEGDGRTCSQMNTCTTNNGGCYPLATCTSSPGKNIFKTYSWFYHAIGDGNYINKGRLYINASQTALLFVKFKHCTATQLLFGILAKLFRERERNSKEARQIDLLKGG